MSVVKGTIDKYTTCTDSVKMASWTLTLSILCLLGALVLFDTGKGDRCHRKRGVCKLAVGSTCMGVSRHEECRYSYYRCCYPPKRGRRRRRRSSDIFEK
ncbi:hypothetical protein ACOMHN_034363 [Nucella lapillus]